MFGTNSNKFKKQAKKVVSLFKYDKAHVYHEKLGKEVLIQYKSWNATFFITAERQHCTYSTLYQTHSSTG